MPRVKGFTTRKKSTQPCIRVGNRWMVPVPLGAPNSKPIEHYLKLDGQPKPEPCAARQKRPAVGVRGRAAKKRRRRSDNASVPPVSRAQSSPRSDDASLAALLLAAQQHQQSPLRGDDGEDDDDARSAGAHASPLRSLGPSPTQQSASPAPRPREEANGEADEEPVDGVVSWSEFEGLLARLKEWRSEPPEELVRVLRDQLADRQTTSAGCTPLGGP